MVSTTAVLAMATWVTTTIDYVQAHGYMADPPCTFKDGKPTTEWVVQIPPPWKADWKSVHSDADYLAMFKKTAALNNYKDVRTLMDGNPLYGSECGYTDPKAKPVDPPSNGMATFSRAIGHAGPCEIWLDKKKVFSSEDCQSSCGDGIAHFKPVDFFFCPPGGCIFRFYWLGLQHLNGKALWQAYKNCIPLTGPPKGGNVTQNELSDDSNVSQTSLDSKSETKAKSSEDKTKNNPPQPPPAENSPETPPAENSPQPPPAGDSPQPPPAGDSPQPPPAGDSPQPPPAENSPETLETTPAPSSKCKGRRFRRH